MGREVFDPAPSRQKGHSIMNLKQAIGAAATLVLLGGISPVQATGTLANSDVNNTATVDYVVGGFTQPTVPSNTAFFETDRRVLVTVTEFSGSYTDVTPGQQDQVLRFSVLNNTNDTLDFRLTATNDALTVADPFGGFDDFDPSTTAVFVDNGDNTYVLADDTQTFIDELAPDTAVTVFIVSDIQGGLADQQTAGLTLSARAAVGGTAAALGADLSETGSDTANVVDTVCADILGDLDIARDCIHSDDDAYRALSATIAAVKTTRVVSDPFNLGINPKRIPGAVVEYCIVVSNTGGTSATGVSIEDDITGQPVTFNSGSLVAGGAVDCTGGSAEDDDALGGDEAPIGANFAGGVATFTLGTIAGGGTTSVRFQVTIIP